MKILQTVRIAALLILCLAPGYGQTAATKVVAAANSFLSTLDEKQRQSVLFAYDDEQQRKRWSNFPVSMVPRSGVSFQDMNPKQRTAALALLAAALSPKGFEKVQQIMEGDEANKIAEGGRGGGRGPKLIFGKELYYFSFLGTPSDTKPWMLQFGGHHLAVNITIAGDRGVLTPTLTGAQPSLFTLDGKTIRPLGQESDKALALLQSLDENQHKQAVLDYRVSDLVLGPGKDGKTIQPEGLKASNMNAKQRTMLLGVIEEWAGIVNEKSAALRMVELKADLDQTWFAWSGSETAEPGRNISAYYRIQGPHLVIEYAPQRMGGDASMHVHTMYRDPTNDYGVKLSSK